MSERLKGIFPDLAEIVARRRKEMFLKRICGFPISEMGKVLGEIFKARIAEDAIDPLIPEQGRKMMADLLHQEPDPEGMENLYRILFNLPIPSTIRSETTITGRAETGLVRTIKAARKVVLKGQRLDLGSGGTVDSVLAVSLPEDIDGVSYFGFAVPNRKKGTFLSVDVHNPTPEIGLITYEFEKRGRERFSFELMVEFEDRQLGDYLTPQRSLADMAVNEYRIIRCSLDDFMDRSGPASSVGVKGTPTQTITSWDNYLF